MIRRKKMKVPFYFVLFVYLNLALFIFIFISNVSKSLMNKCAFTASYFVHSIGISMKYDMHEKMH